MNKKIFAIIMVIALILSSSTFAYANNSGGNNEKKDTTPNKKIHVHLQSGKEVINEVFVKIGDELIPLETNGNSGKYTVPKGTDLVSENLTEIIVKTSDGKTTTYSAEESQQGQEGQGSINYRINATGSNDSEEEVTVDTGDDTSNGTGNTGDNTGSETGGNTGEDSGEDSGGDSGGTGSTDGTGGTDNTTNSPVSNDSETIITIELTLEETPHGTPELESQEITSTEETPIDTEIEEETLDLEDEETPLAIPSTGVATPLFYGAGALISLIGLLKRR